MRRVLKSWGEKGTAVLEYAVGLAILLSFTFFTWRLLLWVYAWNLYVIRTSVQGPQP